MPATDRADLEPSRPTLGANEATARAAYVAVTELVRELQLGWDRHDAELSNRHFAADVLWGSPFGATVRGYAELHAIHVHLKQKNMCGRAARFEIVQVLAPAPDVALAHVRRVALDAEGRPLPPNARTDGAFWEMALYVLVKRDGIWWLAAGQNTPLGSQPAE